MPQCEPETSSVSLSPLHYPLFRAVWVATLAANIGVWMQNVAAAWLMTSISDSPLMVALIQTAITLPAFMFGLPAGVMADLVEKRKLLLLTHTWMLIATGLLCLLLQLDAITPWSLLLLTFLLGSGSAASIPAWQASTSDAVPRIALRAAINLNGIAYNAARAVGPALAGLVIAAAGAKMVFTINIVLFLIVLSLFIFAYRPNVAPLLTTERLFPAMRGGLRYVRHAKPLHGHIIRTFAFIGCASGLWALLPLVAKNIETGGSSVYGLLLGSLGAGAVAGGLLLQRFRNRLSNLQQLVMVSNVAFAGAILIAAWSTSLWVICPALIMGGASWISFNSTISAAYQTSLPAWVRARALAIFMLTFQGSMALGGVFWGSIASHLSVAQTLTLAACLIGLSLLLTRRLPVRMGHDDDVTLSQHWAEPTIVGHLGPDDGPVAVQVDYHIPYENRFAFTQSIYQLGKVRRRDGASHWLLYRDVADPGHFSERFIIASWGEHQRQRGRSTLADREQEQALRQFFKPGSSAVMSLYIVAPYPDAAADTAIQKTTEAIVAAGTPPPGGKSFV
ncbi:putative MFS family arabinose efflux permease [Pseudomonas sp. SJZ103]|nr:MULTISPECIES: MFS transporter [unclassified Pseudomonas]MBB6290766.1 MFS family permease [Pseudomonas sp. SJZ073]MBB6315506.1 MFS family permease [Pseudomonas sp. JAI120]TWC61527.1 putative MFS family arabinose efflux permease [Pseudomonas sp. SJZ103]TWC78723.1 putative MFS family arabinose efflux permease [Pseudomonas sp. SJZ094]